MDSSGLMCLFTSRLQLVLAAEADFRNSLEQRRMNSFLGWIFPVKWMTVLIGWIFCSTVRAGSVQFVKLTTIRLDKLKES